jgi:hypothetical protein
VNAFVENAVYWALVYFHRVESAGKIKLELVFTKNFLSNSIEDDPKK